MADEQKKAPAGKPAVFVVMGLALVTIAMINHGPLQIVLLVAAIGLLVYAVVLTRKNKAGTSTNS